MTQPKYEIFCVSGPRGKNLQLRGVRLSKYFAHTRGVSLYPSHHPDTLTHLPTGYVLIAGVNRKQARRLVEWMEVHVHVKGRLRRKSPKLVAKAIGLALGTGDVGAVAALRAIAEGRKGDRCVG